MERRGPADWGSVDPDMGSGEISIGDIVGGHLEELGFDSDRIVDEETIAQLQETLPNRLKKLGIDKALSITADHIIELVGAGYDDDDDVEDLYLHVWEDVRKKLGPYAQVRIGFMVDNARETECTGLLKSWDDAAIKDLRDLGIDSDEILELYAGNDRQKRFMRRLDWLLSNEPVLRQLNIGLKSSSARGVKVSPLSVASHIQSILSDLNEKLSDMDIEKMSELEKILHRAESQRIVHISAVAKSLINGVDITPRELLNPKDV